MTEIEYQELLLLAVIEADRLQPLDNEDLFKIIDVATAAQKANLPATAGRLAHAIERFHTEKWVEFAGDLRVIVLQSAHPEAERIRQTRTASLSFRQE